MKNTNKKLEIEKVKEELKEMYPEFKGFIEHTFVARMCLTYHNKKKEDKEYKRK